MSTVSEFPEELPADGASPPFHLVVCGPTSSGKSILLNKLVAQFMRDGRPAKKKGGRQ